LLYHLILASPEHKELAKTLQSTAVAFRDKLKRAIEEGWRDCDVILSGVAESGGMGLGGSGKKAREVMKPVLGEWRGLGVLAR